MKGIPLAERAINEYWDVTLEKGRKSGLRLIQLAQLAQFGIERGESICRSGSERSMS